MWKQKRKIYNDELIYMKGKIVFLLVLAVTVYSCKEDYIKMLPGSWRVVKVKDHAVDSTILYSQMAIDTMGKGHDDATNMRIYGFVNMDSARKSMQALHDKTVAEKDSVDKSTLFTFRKDGMAVITFGGSKDSSHWKLDDANNLLVEDYQMGPGEVLKWKIAALDKKELKLLFNAKGDTIMVTFKREQ